MDSRPAIDCESLFSWNRGELWTEDKTPFEYACGRLEAAQASRPDPSTQWQLSIAFCTFLRSFIEHSRDDALRIKTIEDLAACDLDSLLALPPLSETTNSQGALRARGRFSPQRLMSI